VNGRDSEARNPMNAALGVGIQDVKMFRHAAEIASRTGDPTSARRYLKLAAELEGKTPKLATAKY
jgi:hypothetical protein